jgi:tripartite-type tricarboxylate transporter receptor subunit TctC
MDRLLFSVIASAPFFLTALPYPVFAQLYPAKPIRMIVPFAPGGPNDILARIVGSKLHESLGQPMIVDNRGGAGGTVGLAQSALLPADGYSLAMGGTSNLTVAPSLYKKLSYDSLKDFTPVSNIAIVPYAIGVNPVVPAQNVKELIAVARRKKDQLSYASSGTGSISSLAAEMFKSMARVEIVHVPYKGTAPALSEVVGGQVDLMFADLSLIERYGAAGKLRVIAVTGARRSPLAPLIPTVSESGLKGYEVSPWFGVVGPAGIPREIVSRLNGAIVAALKSTEVLQRLSSLGYEPIVSTPEEFAATIRSDLIRYREVVRRTGLTGSL